MKKMSIGGGMGGEVGILPGTLPLFYPLNNKTHAPPSIAPPYYTAFSAIRKEMEKPLTSLQNAYRISHK